MLTVSQIPPSMGKNSDTNEQTFVVYKAGDFLHNVQNITNHKLTLHLVYNTI